MSWHDSSCENLDFAWVEAAPRCYKCNRSASRFLNDTIEAPPPPPHPPPKGPRRTQLKLSWPPSVKYSGRTVDESGKDLASVLVGNVPERCMSPGPRLSGAEKIETSATISRRRLPHLDSSNRKTGLEKTSGHIDGLGQRPQSNDPIYEDLPKPDGFRLLRLHGASSFQAPVHRPLKVRRLDDPGLCIYEAVSYTWADLDGDKRNCLPVFIGAQCQVLLVGKNCQLALRSLRTRHDRVLWVDAICIDQHNLLERELQVGLMRSIYTMAARDVVYLGEMRGASDQAMKAVAASAVSNRDEREALLQLSRRSYFRRIWVIQEVGLAQKASVTCGNQTAYWTDMCFIFDFCGIRLNWIRHVSSPKGGSSEAPRLLQLLVDTKASECADPRDRVYGLMGLLNPEEAKLLPVDYTLSVQHLYTGLAAYWATQEWDSPDNKFILFAQSDMKLPGLPSWVPDWSNLAGSEPIGLTLSIDVTAIPLNEPSWGLYVIETIARDDPFMWDLLPYQMRLEKSSSSSGEISGKATIIPRQCADRACEVDLQEHTFYERRSRRTYMNCHYHSDHETPKPPSIDNDFGLLNAVGCHIFSFRQELLTIRKQKKKQDLPFDYEKLDGHTRLLQGDNELEIFQLPQWGKALVLKRRADSIFSVEGSFSIVLTPSARRGLQRNVYQARTPLSLSRFEEAEDYIRLQEMDLALSWEVAIQFLEERLSQRYPGSIVDVNQKPCCCCQNLVPCLSDTMRSVAQRRSFSNASWLPITKAHVESMNHMRTKMLRSLESENVGLLRRDIKTTDLDKWFQPPSKECPPLASAFRNTVARFTRLDESPEDLVNLWRQDMEALERIMCQRSYSEDLLDVDYFQQPHWKFSHPYAETEIMDAPRFIYMAFRHIEASVLDAEKPWEWNRDRFWVCVISFDLIARFREFLRKRHTLSLIMRALVIKEAKLLPLTLI